MFKIYTHVKYFKMKYFQINKDKNQQHQDMCDTAITTLKRAICSLDMCNKRKAENSKMSS